jgi:hypothetical protein
MKILIVDFHAGCISAAASTLIDMGHEVTIISLSGHTHLLHNLGLSEKIASGALESRLLKRLGIRKGDSPKQIIAQKNWIPRRGGHEFDYAFVFFPPGLYKKVLVSRVAQRVIIVASHRFDMWFGTAKRREKFHKDLLKDIENGCVQLVASNSFDARYIHHYLNLKVKVLPPCFPYLPELNIQHINRSHTALVGPAHARPEVKELIKSLKLPKEIRPRTIRELYGNYQFHDLLNHFKIVIFPYSVYSISLSEIASLGLVLLIPTDRWLQQSGILDDVQLFPYYGKEEKLAFQSTKHLGLVDPNIGRLGMEWIRHASWKSFPNVEYWDTEAELEKLISLPRTIEDIESYSRRAVDWNNENRVLWENFFRSL